VARSAATTVTGASQSYQYTRLSQILPYPLIPQRVSRLGRSPLFNGISLCPCYTPIFLPSLAMSYVQAGLYAMVAGVAGGIFTWEVIRRIRDTPSNPPPAVRAADGAAIISAAELIANARTQLGMDVALHYNIGICGNGGSGKSTFINAVRGLPDVRPRDETAAETSSAGVDIVEATSRLRRYTFTDPSYSHVKLWDLKGGGTVAQRGEDYFRDNALYAFDCLLVMTAERFTDLDNSIAVQARQHGTPIAMVVNKGDTFLDTVSQAKYQCDFVDLNTDAEKRAVESEVIARKKSDIRFHLATADNRLVDMPVFVISSKQFARATRGLHQTAPVMEAPALFHFILQAALERRNPH
jgi:GTPase SAR1 family protein